MRFSHHAISNRSFVFSWLLLSVAAHSLVGISSSDFVQRSRSGLDYNLYVPYGSGEPESGHAYPLVIYLHGLGGGRTPTAPISGNQGYFRLAEDPQNPTFVIAPVSAGEGWWGAYTDDIAALVVELQAEFPIDPDRVYITGASAGGQGTWLCLMESAELYAAAVPIYGGKLATAENVETFIHKPIWCFHAADDNVVSVGNSDTMIDWLRRAGGTPIYTRYSSGGHGVSGSAYATTVMRDWLFAQVRGQSTPQQIPYVEVTTPSENPAFAQGTSLTVAGVAHNHATTDVVSGVQLINYRAGEVTASGTTTWSANSVPVRVGGENTIQCLATGTSYNSSRGGLTTFSTTLTAYASDTANDEQAPMVSISLPMPDPVDTGGNYTQSLFGQAIDVIGITSVTWENNRGGSGSASGTEVWTAAGIPLVSGSNEITITAHDAAGNTGIARQVVVLGSASNLPPHVSIASVSEFYLPQSSIDLTGTVDDDGFSGAPLTLAWSMVSGPGSVSFSSGNALVTSATFSESGEYVLRLTASDGEWSDSADVTVIMQPSPGALVKAINCAGTAYTASDGTVFEADAYFTGGNGGNLYNDIANTTDDTLYARYRYNTFSYAVPLTPGSYVVDLYFADSSGLRMFDVFLEDSLVLGEFAPGAEYGIKTAVKKRFTVSVPDGTLSITFGNIFEGPMLSAFAIREVGVGGVVANLPPSVNAGVDTVILLPENSLSLNGQVTDDGLPVDGGLSYAWTQVSGPDVVSFQNASLLQTTVSFPSAGVYTLRLTANDGELAGSDSIEVSVSQAGAHGEVIAAINCGEFSNAYTSETEATVFSVDTNYSGGSAAGITTEIADTEDDTLFHRYRYGNHSYSIPVQNDTYTVTLFFSDNSAVGNRVFDVLIEGVVVLSQFDIRSQVATNTALRKVFTPTVSDGVLNVQIRNITGNGKINAILVTRELPVETGFEKWMTEHSLAGADRAFDADPDWDGVPNLAEYAFGCDPMAFNRSPVDAVAYAEGDIPSLYVSLTYNADLDDVVIEVQHSTNLLSWTTLATIEGMNVSGYTPVSDTMDGAMRTLGFSEPLAAEPEESQGFIRFLVY